MTATEVVGRCANSPDRCVVLLVAGQARAEDIDGTD